MTTICGYTDPARHFSCTGPASVNRFVRINGERRTACVEHGERIDQQWAIRSDTPDPLDNEALYWSNVDGWVDLGSADRFDAPDGNLPIGGQWEVV